MTTHGLRRPSFRKNFTKARKRDEFKCQICGRGPYINGRELAVHHIIPRSKGGSNELDNLVTLCSGCHMSVESGNEIKAIIECVKRALDK